MSGTADKPMTRPFTQHEMLVLLELIDDRARLAAAIAQHPRDASRNDSLRRQASERMNDYRHTLEEGFGE